MRFLTVELDGTQRRINKSCAKDLIASGCYKWSEPGENFELKMTRRERRHEGNSGVFMARVLVAIPLELRPKMTRSSRRGYSELPVKLPPREVANCIFRPPDSDEWKLAHRNMERDLQMAADSRFRKLLHDSEADSAQDYSCAQSAAIPFGPSPLLSGTVQS